MKEVNFLMSNWGNSHQINRFLEIEKLGYLCNLYVFERLIYESRVKRNYVSLGKITPGKYKNRILTYFKVLFKLNRLLNEKDIFYVFGLDIILLLTLVLIFKRKNKNIKIIYEVPDIRPIQYGTSIKSSVVRFLEKLSFKNIKLLIVTSESYFTEFYKNSHNYPEVIFYEFENKLHQSKEELKSSKNFKCLPANKLINSRGKLIIGYFGMIRDPKSLVTLIELSMTNKFFIIIRGVFMKNCEKFHTEIISSKNMFFGGSYFSPNDLDKMYSEIDISWVVYPYNSSKEGNWKWAKTNRFYEAGFFKIPMIGLIGSKDGEIIKNNDLGLEVDLSNSKKALMTLEKINVQKINIWKENITELPIENFVYTNEYDNLNSLMQNIVYES
jgi:succinoglycan biosynthesis protein ExoL